MGDIYSDFAQVYDELMDGTPYEAWKERIVRLIREYGVSRPVRQEIPEGSIGEAFSQEGSFPERGEEPWLQTDAEVMLTEQAGDEEALDAEDGAEDPEIMEKILASERDLVVDLGCGTGTLTELLYRAGYDMVGVDNSEAMLERAMEKRDESGAEILYLLQDMRELSLYSTVGTIISVCDSVNYLLEEDELSKLFSLVNNYLFPGGIFIFDFNTDYKYREIIGDRVIAENREDCSFIWENDYDPEGRINEYDLTLFLRRDGELFEKVTETHLQRGYQPEEMIRLLRQAGLQVLLMRDADTDGEISAVTERAYVVAREQGK